MPNATPLPDWSGEEVFIVGGGSSLRGFNFDRLILEKVIGCNQAFLRGPAVCDVCVFGDIRFWEAFHKELEAYAGWVATNYAIPHPPAWLKSFARTDHGLVNKGLAWNGHTGALAVNLALVLGAQHIYLLGFDMQILGTRSHWHDRRLEVPTPAHYDRFMSGFDTVAQCLPQVFPGRRVYNVSDGTSKLKAFPVVSFEEAGLRSPQKGKVVS